MPAAASREIGKRGAGRARGKAASISLMVIAKIWRWKMSGSTGYPSAQPAADYESS